ncbi:MAG: T9SS type A sorting domain-containing protein [Flavobacteriia bacterium]|nr:T9SS type A sorting domain-containing protein [Flavobacteriia bacterium]
MKTILFTLFLISNLAYSQNNWQITAQACIGGDQSEGLIGTLKLSNGYNLLYGRSNSGISGDKTELNYGLADYWLVAIDDNLTIQWQKTIGGNLNDQISKVIESQEHFLYLTGYSESDITGNKSAINYGGTDTWVVKMDLNGNIIWDKSYGGNLGDIGSDIIELESGNLILLNTSSSDVSGNKTSLNKGSNDYWLVKIDSDGFILMDQTFGGINNDVSGSVLKINQNQLLLDGFSNSSISGDKSENSYGLNDGWLIKIDTNGAIINDFTLGGSGDDYIKINNMLIINNLLFLVGQSNSPISGNKMVSNYQNSTDCWIVKMDENFNIINQIAIGSDSTEIPSYISVFNTNLLISTASYSGINQFKSEANHGKLDNWYFEVDENLNFLGNKSFGSNGYESLAFTLQSSTTELLLASYSGGKNTGDKTCVGHNTNNTSTSPSDFWVYKVSTDAGIKEQEIDKFQIFPNPIINAFIIQTENQIDRIEILGNDGKIVLEKEFSDKNYYVNSNELQAGIYYCKIVDNNGNLVIKKLVKA